MLNIITLSIQESTPLIRHSTGQQGPDLLNLLMTFLHLQTAVISVSLYSWVSQGQN